MPAPTMRRKPPVSSTVIAGSPSVAPGRCHERTQGPFVDRPHGGKGLAGGTLSLPLPSLQRVHAVVVGMDLVHEVVARLAQQDQVGEGPPLVVGHARVEAIAHTLASRIWAIW